MTASVLNGRSHHRHGDTNMKSSEMRRWGFRLLLALMIQGLLGCRTFNMTREEVEAEQRGEFKSSLNMQYERGKFLPGGDTDNYKAVRKAIKRR